MQEINLDEALLFQIHLPLLKISLIRYGIYDKLTADNLFNI